jgi:hypothetical protein
MSNVINFAVPGMYEHADLNFDLLNIYKYIRLNSLQLFL